MTTGWILIASAAAGLAACAGLVPVLRALGLGRTNFEGRPLCAGGGILFLIAGVLSPWLLPTAGGLPAAAAVTGFGLLGLMDDRWGSAEFKGFRGHLGALGSGRLTTGLLKAAAGAALAVGLAGWLRPDAGVLLAAPLIALSANAFNLFDLRPLRTLKLFWLTGLLLLPSAPPLLVAALGLSLPLALLESRRRVMLGDTGANALGGLAGVALVQNAPLWTQALVLVLLVLFHAWTENHSLTLWIERRPWANAIDSWGWRETRDKRQETGDRKQETGDERE